MTSASKPLGRRHVVMKNIILVIVVLAASACYRTKRLAAPPPPQQIVPSVSLDGEPGDGLSRVVLDSADGPAVVEKLSGGSVAGVAGVTSFGGSLQVSRRVCVTPCVLDTSPGPHELRFTLVDDGSRTSTGFVNVDTRTSVYRHAVGRHRNKAWKGFVGWPILALGVLIDLAAIAVASKGEFEGGGDITMAGVGVGATVLGGWLVIGSVIEEQPGTGVHWHPDRQAGR
jgi:hypothetical protein